MTGAADMRRVIATASGLIEQCIGDVGDHRAVAAMAYARGVLDGLGAYLTDAEPATSAQRELVLIDDDGDTWRCNRSGLWTCEESDNSYTHKDDVASNYGPVQEVWV